MHGWLPAERIAPRRLTFVMPPSNGLLAPAALRPVETVATCRRVVPVRWGVEPTLPDPADRQNLDPFEERLAAAKARSAPEPRQVVVSALARGTRHAFEIAATTLVGAGLGWMIDRWLGTGPWGFLLLLLLGVMAGFWNLLKAVNAEAAAVRREAGAVADEAAGDDDRQGRDG